MDSAIRSQTDGEQGGEKDGGQGNSQVAAFTCRKAPFRQQV